MTPSAQRSWLLPGGRFDTRPVVMTPQEFERGVEAGTIAPSAEALAALARISPSGVRAAAEHQQRLAGIPAPICPECKAGKHTNCDGTAWDTTTDQRTDCACFLTSRNEHGS